MDHSFQFETGSERLHQAQAGRTLAAAGVLSPRSAMDLGKSLPCSESHCPPRKPHVTAPWAPKVLLGHNGAGSAEALWEAGSSSRLTWNSLEAWAPTPPRWVGGAAPCLGDCRHSVPTQQGAGAASPTWQVIVMAPPLRVQGPGCPLRGVHPQVPALTEGQEGQQCKEEELHV